VLGGVIGGVLSQLPGWVAQLPWAPFQEPLEGIAEFAGPVMTSILIVLGVIAGCVVAMQAYDDIVKIEVTNRTVAITRSGDTKSLERGQVAAVFADGKDLVLLGQDRGELARERTDRKPGELRKAFDAQGYPWYDDDPHAAEFARWVDGMPGLGDHANALLRARQTALDSDDSDDAAELHVELATLGVVVRDDKKRQYWRLARHRTQ
jgi:hypothetical protein